MKSFNISNIKVLTLALALSLLVLIASFHWYQNIYKPRIASQEDCSIKLEKEKVKCLDKKYKLGNIWVEGLWSYHVEKRVGDFYRMSVVGADESNELTGGSEWGNIDGTWSQSNFESVNCNSILKLKVPVELDEMFGVCYTTNRVESPELFPVPKEELSPFTLIKVTDVNGYYEVDKDYSGNAIYHYTGITSLDFKYTNKDGEICYEAVNLNEILPMEKPQGKQMVNSFCTAMTRDLLMRVQKDHLIIEDLEDGRVVSSDFEGVANIEISGYDIRLSGTDTYNSLNISKVNKVYK